MVLLSVFVLGGPRGPVSFRAVKGKGGESALVVVLLSVFVLGGAGEGGPVSFGVVLFCGEWRRVSFRGL